VEKEGEAGVERRLNPQRHVAAAILRQERAHVAHLFEDRAVTSRFDNPVVNPRPFEDAETAEPPLQAMLPVSLFVERVIYKAEAGFGMVKIQRIAFDGSRIDWRRIGAISVSLQRVVIYLDATSIATFHTILMATIKRRLGLDADDFSLHLSILI
jgi:hypothetical protein